MRTHYGRVITLCNYKGGVGKSTLAIHLSGLMASDSHNKTTMLIDSDDQGTITKWYAARKRLYPELVKKERLLFQTVNPQEAHIATLAHSIAVATEANDYVVVDTKGASTTEVTTSMQMADIVLIPCAPEFPDLIAIENIYNDFQQANENRRVAGIVPVVAVVVFNRVTDRKNAGSNSDIETSRAYVAETYPQLTVYPGRVSRRVAYHRSLADGRNVVDRMDGSREDLDATNEIYDLATFIESKLKEIPAMPFETSLPLMAEGE